MTSGTDAPDSNPLTELAECRTKIEEIDRRIIALIAERVTIGKRTAGLKRAAGMPILDPQREAEVIRRATMIAREHELSTEGVREMFWHVVGLSRRAQEGVK